jgi:hypothetical protein
VGVVLGNKEFTECCGGDCVVAGVDTSLVSMECVVAEAGVAGTATLLAFTATLFYIL